MGIEAAASDSAYQGNDCQAMLYVELLAGWHFAKVLASVRSIQRTTS
jgi:hypothetical protein